MLRSLVGSEMCIRDRDKAGVKEKEKDKAKAKEREEKERAKDRERAKEKERVKEKSKEIKKREEKSVGQDKKKKKAEEIDIVEERKKFWDEAAKKKVKNEDITDTIRSDNVAKLRTMLERCKYLKLTSLDALNVAKRLENACYTENPKSRKGYDRFMTATTSGLKNIRKMKYLSLRFMELNYDLDYIYQFKDMEIETLQKQNDRTKEDMIQKLSLIHI
eukprot:TRINITY_DN1910_c0_g1_i6.p2 TRINITY_DN1910_c0_g1~~TRINITY_DN1910_c0_g1_i6.p2  ORF type:complete len:218 (+),score=90.07 TRINITY_DN1910_c0_g1_i6:52-705(+)